MNTKFILSKIFKKLRISSVRSSKIHATSKIESGSSVYFSSFDRYSFCGYDCELYHADIGSFTSIANQVVIGGARHPMEWVGMSPVFYKGRDSVRMKFSEHELNLPERTSIGHDVWLGHSAIILSGVHVGNGAVVGAGAVVTKDVPPYAIVAGNPAKLIRYRFTEDLVNELMEIKWWDINEENLFKLAILAEKPKEFIRYFRELNLICNRVKS
jgi:acetyltransferase-like isoleucine patch superfamily enzyme